LLERRPDVRAGGRIIVAANAQIGVAKASFFPSISLTGTGGLESNALNRFINAPSQTWFGALSVARLSFKASSPIGAEVEPSAISGGSARLSADRAELAGASFELRSSHIKKIVTSAGSKNCSPRRPSGPISFSLVLYQHGGASYLQC